MIPLRNALAFTCIVALVACAHRERPPLGDIVPFDQRLAQFQSLHNRVATEELRPFFTKNATIQSPISPRPASIEKYLEALKTEPYQLIFTRTEVVYSLPKRAATRSAALASATGRFDLRERVTVEWRVENDYWRISRIAFSDWSPVVGAWRRSSANKDGAIELRILPDGNYLVYVARDYSMPRFRGRYQLEANKIVFTDTAASDPQELQSAEGSYFFVQTPTGLDFRRIQDENSWRAERFEGLWSASR